MRLRVGLASLIWAAIFMIAAQFAAGSAFAHAGHAHGRIVVSQSAAAHTGHMGKSLSKLQAVAAEAKVSITRSQRADEPAPAQTGGCAGGCCGNGIGCCGVAITAVFDSLPDLALQQAPVPLRAYSSSGIDPEALIRPPRTLV